MPEPFDPIDEVVSEFLEARRRGEPVSVDDYVARYPDLAEELRDLLPTVAAVEQLKRSKERCSAEAPALGPGKIERLGDFRIVREVGRGGMGIVYEAEQESLSRRVAVKVLPMSMLLTPKHLERFKREAQVSAGLHHTNIVQVFGVGAADGYHYYVMQLIDGVGLDELIEGLRSEEGPSARSRRLFRQDSGSGRSSWPRSAARLILQAAEALAYAHGQGVLHRDIKPSNLLLDERNVLWVTDFGLAKAVAAVTVTEPGDLTGTLAYMPPERLAGEVTARGDQYSLGLTLYELLTLQPAFADVDRTRLLHRISSELPKPPRRIDPSIPADLETICLKAAAPDPADRYESADAMAADLRLFLADRPIKARRVGLGERFMRWSKRNPAVASLTAAVLVLLATVAGVAAGGYVRTKAALAREADQRVRAEEAAAIATEALDSTFERLAPAAMLGRSQLSLPGSADSADSAEDAFETMPVSKRTAALLQEMLPFYDRLARGASDEDGVRKKIALANRRVGDIHRLLGAHNEALDAYTRAVDACEQLYRSTGRTEFAVEAAGILNEMGKVHFGQRRINQGDDAHRRALAILAASSADSPAVQFELARTHYLLGAGGRPDPGVDTPAMGSNRPGRPGPPLPVPERGRGRRQRREHLTAATKLAERLVELSGDDGAYRHLLALCYREQSAPRGLWGRDADGQGRMKALEILATLCEEFPYVSEYRHELSETYAMVRIDPRRSAAAYESMEAQLLQSLEISDKLVADNPNVPRYAASRAQVLGQLADLQKLTNRFDEARRNLTEAIELQAPLVSEDPTNIHHRAWLGAARISHAELLLRAGQAEVAAGLLGPVEEDLTSLLSDDKRMRFVHGLLEKAYAVHGDALRRMGDEPAANRAATRAEDHRGKARRGPPRPVPDGGGGRGELSR